jgi:hypothetical protein
MRRRNFIALGVAENGLAIALKACSGAARLAVEHNLRHPPYPSLTQLAV